MARVKRGVIARARHKKILKQAKGNAVYARTRTVVAFGLFQNFLVTCACNYTTFYASHSALLYLF